MTLKLTNADLSAHIEEILERGPSCASFISDEIGADFERTEKLLSSLKREKVIEKDTPRFVAGERVQFFRIAQPQQIQKSIMIDGDPAVKRDPLVAALFGEASK